MAQPDMHQHLGSSYFYRYSARWGQGSHHSKVMTGNADKYFLSRNGLWVPRIWTLLVATRHITEPNSKYRFCLQLFLSLRCSWWAGVAILMQYTIIVVDFVVVITLSLSTNKMTTMSKSDNIDDEQKVFFFYFFHPFQMFVQSFYAHCHPQPSRVWHMQQHQLQLDTMSFIIIYMHSMLCRYIWQ